MNKKIFGIGLTILVLGALVFTVGGSVFAQGETPEVEVTELPEPAVTREGRGFGPGDGTCDGTCDELTTLMAMAFRISCVCRMAPALVCSTVMVTDRATVHVMELATLMAMAFPIRIGCAMVVTPVCNTVPALCRVVRAMEPARAWVLDLATNRPQVSRALECATALALVTKQFV